MIKEFDLFHNEEELEELTGLSKEGLKENGFHVDCYDGDDKLDFYGGIRLKREQMLRESASPTKTADIEDALLSKIVGWKWVESTTTYDGYIYYLSHSKDSRDKYFYSRW